MTNTFKNKLLLGTALVAVGAMASASAHAITLTADSTYASAGGANSTVDITNLQADEDINLDGNELNIINDQTADDGNGTDSFSIGDITDSASDGTATVSLDIDQGDGNAGSDMTIAINSVAVNAAILINNSAAQDGAITITVAEGLSTADATDGDLTIVVGSDQNDNNISLSIGKNLTVADDLSLTSSDGAGGTGAAAILDVDGNTTVTGATTLTTVGEGDVLVNLAGNATFTGGVSIEEGVGAGEGDAIITLNGSTKQTIAGDIDGATAAEGTIRVNNTGTGGVVFTGEIGGTNGIALIDIGQDNSAETVTFQNTVKATAITLSGNGDADDVVVNFDSQDNDFTVTGAIGADNAGDDNTINVIGGGTVTFANGTTVSGDIDTLAVGASTTLITSGSNISATAVTLGSGAEINDTAGIVYAGTINGTAANLGTLDIDNNTEVTGQIGNTFGLLAIEVAAAGSLIVDAGAATAVKAQTITLQGVGSSLVFEPDTFTTTVTGNIVTDVNGEGDITVNGGAAGTVAFVGNIGTSTKTLDFLTVTGAGTNQTVTTTGNLYVDTITLDDADVLQLIGTSAQTVSGSVDGINANDGVVRVGNGSFASSVTFNGELGGNNKLGTFDVTKNATAIVNGDANEFNGDVTIDGTLRLTQGVLLTANDVATGTNEGVLEFVIGTTTGGVDESGTLDLAAAVDWHEFDGTTADSADTLLKQGTGVILNGQDFKIIDGDGATLVANLAVAGEAVDDEYALFDFKAYSGNVKTVGGSDLSDVVVEATHADTDNVTINSNNANAADGLLDVSVAEYAADTDGVNELALVYDNVTRATNNQIDERLEAIQSTVDGGNVVAATTVANITSNIIQLASTDAEGSGIAAGNISNGLRAWAQVFGQTGEQDDRDSIDGYDIDTYGFAVGLDTQALADQMVIGLAFSYADSEVDSDNANNTTTEIDTYQVTLYGTYNIDEATYLSGQLGYAFGDNSTRRNNLGGVASVDANGDFDSNQFIARLEAGRAYEVGAITTLTPKVLVNYNYYDADSYRETGAGGAGLTVDQDTNHILEIGAGVDADWMFQQADGSYVKPQLRAGVRYDLADDEIEATNRLIGGGNAFKTEGFDPQQFAVDLGAGVTYFSTTNWELTANYDFEYKEDYHSHAGFLRAAYKF